jgi:hypothetical protein
MIRVMMMVMVMMMMIIIIIIGLLARVLTTDQLVKNLPAFCGNVIHYHIHKSIWWLHSLS